MPVLCCPPDFWHARRSSFHTGFHTVFQSHVLLNEQMERHTLKSLVQLQVPSCVLCEEMPWTSISLIMQGGQWRKAAGGDHGREYQHSGCRGGPCLVHHQGAHQVLRAGLVESLRHRLCHRILGPVPVHLQVASQQGRRVFPEATPPLQDMTMQRFLLLSVRRACLYLCCAEGCCCHPEPVMRASRSGVLVVLRHSLHLS